MSRYNFGKDIERKFYPLEDNEPINLPSQAPSIFLFNDQPTFDAARSGIGAVISEIEYWSESATAPYPRTYTIPAIEDPYPEDATPRCLGYWEAVNYIVKTSGQLQTKLRYFEIEKARAVDSVPGTTPADLRKIYPAIDDYVDGDTDLANFIQVAQDQIKTELKGKGIEWGMVLNLKELKYALAFLTIQLFSESQIVDAEDRFAIRADIYSKRYASIMSMVTLQFDKDGDGKSEAEAKTAGPLIGYK